MPRPDGDLEKTTEAVAVLAEAALA